MTSLFLGTVEAVKCITLCRFHNLAVGAFVYNLEEATRINVIRISHQGKAGVPTVSVEGQTYPKRAFLYNTTPVPWKNRQKGYVPIRQYPYRSAHPGYTVSNYPFTEMEGVASGNLEPTPCFMALVGSKPRRKHPSWRIKFQLISVTSRSNTSHSGRWSEIRPTELR